MSEELEASWAVVGASPDVFSCQKYFLDVSRLESHWGIL